MTGDPFRCICPLDPADLVNGYPRAVEGCPRAVEGCPAHRARYAAQQVALRETSALGYNLALLPGAEPTTRRAA